MWSDTTPGAGTAQGIDALVSRLPGLDGVLLAAKIAGHADLNIDGTVIRTDRVSIPGPTKGVDLWWSGKHKHHGGNIQVITAPDGWPLRASPVRPRRQHDTSAARSHDGLLDSLTAWSTGGRKDLADLDYLGETDRLTVPTKVVKGTELSTNAKTANLLPLVHPRDRRRGNALIKNYKAARHVTLSPDHVGPITAAIVVLLHTKHDRTT